MKTGDKCTYITRSGSEIPARVIATGTGTVFVEAQRADDGLWLDLGERDIVTEDEVIATRAIADADPNPKKKDDALKDVRGKVHQKAKDKAKDKEKELKSK